jgi:class 3 adenylate cyclase
MNAAENMHNMNVNNAALGGQSMLEIQFNELKDFFYERLNKPFLLFAEVNGTGYSFDFHTNDIAYWDGLRDSSIEEYTFSDGVYSTHLIFSKEVLQRKLAYLQIALTIFVSIMLVAGAVVLNDDVEKLVLTPINKMMNLVETIAKDPLKPIQQHTAADGGQYETRLLETTIQKITGLLRVGFGEAGAGIISSSLNINDTSGKILDPLTGGLRIYCVVGFCDIHKFDDVNQRMGVDVLRFVNSIAAIVHGCIQDWGGQSNKNLGNAFVLVWRIGDEEALLALTSGQAAPAKDAPGKPGKKNRERVVDLRRVPGVDSLTDKALIGYLKIIVELNRQENILDYRKEPRLTNQNTTEFIVRMGFGLHAGWAIEGAVGSLEKIDATYLSPHVNMAARLETSSRQYGVPVLISQIAWELMSPPVQNLCRKLDVVTVKGSEFPIGIYTYDCNQSLKFKPAPHNFQTGKARRSTGDKIREKRDSHTNAHGNGDFELSRINSMASSVSSSNSYVFRTAEDDSADCFEDDVDLLDLRSHVTSEFLKDFQKGIDTYLGGDWPTARVFLNKANEMMSQVPGFEGTHLSLTMYSPVTHYVFTCGFVGDGPSLTLLRYMEEREWTAPADWAGYRPLTSK